MNESEYDENKFFATELNRTCKKFVAMEEPFEFMVQKTNEKNCPKQAHSCFDIFLVSEKTFLVCEIYFLRKNSYIISGPAENLIRKEEYSLFVNLLKDIYINVLLGPEDVTR